MAEPVHAPELNEKERLAVEMRLAGETRRAIMKGLGVNGVWLSKLIAKAGLPPRPSHVSRQERRRAKARAAQAGGGEPIGGDLSTREQIERFVRARLFDLQARAARRTHDPERIARALAIHTRTLVSLRRMPAEAPARQTLQDHDDPKPPRTLNELRDELRRHLLRIQDEERAGPGP